jgi:hypothetical protein
MKGVSHYLVGTPFLPMGMAESIGGRRLAAQ